MNYYPRQLAGFSHYFSGGGFSFLFFLPSPLPGAEYKVGKWIRGKEKDGEIGSGGSEGNSKEKGPKTKAAKERRRRFSLNSEFCRKGDSLIRETVIRQFPA